MHDIVYFNKSLGTDKGQKNRFLLSPACFSALHKEASQAYPNEACGFILGHCDNATKILAAPNRAPSPHHAFILSPESLLLAEKTARQANIMVLGIYHSHPDSPAWPSRIDTEQTPAGWWNVILDCYFGTCRTMRSFRKSPDNAALVEEEWKVAE